MTKHCGMAIFIVNSLFVERCTKGTRYTYVATCGCTVITPNCHMAVIKGNRSSIYMYYKSLDPKR